MNTLNNGNGANNNGNGNGEHIYSLVITWFDNGKKHTDLIGEYTFPKTLSEAREHFETLLKYTGDGYSIRRLVNPYVSEKAVLLAARDIVRNVTANMVDNKRNGTTYQSFVWKLYNDIRTNTDNSDIDDMISEAAIAVVDGIKRGLSVWAIYRNGYSAVNTYVCRCGIRGQRAGKQMLCDDTCFESLAAKLSEYFSAEAMDESDCNELVSITDKIMDELTALQRDTFIAYVDGFSVRDIARYRGGKAPSTIHKQLAAARRFIGIRLLSDHTDVLPLEIVWNKEIVIADIVKKSKAANN